MYHVLSQRKGGKTDNKFLVEREGGEAGRSSFRSHKTAKLYVMSDVILVLARLSCKSVIPGDIKSENCKRNK